MKILLIILVIIAVLVIAGIIYTRSLSHDSSWHVDPLTAPTPSSPNSYRVGPTDGAVEVDAVAPVFDVDADKLGDRFNAMALGRPRVEVMGGSVGAGWVTYVQRSALFGFPDYISVRFIDLAPSADGTPQSTLSLLSRSRLGESDLGVNEKRVTAWLAELQN